MEFYDILESETKQDLTEQVREKLNENWIPFGGVETVRLSGILMGVRWTRTMFYQSIMQYDYYQKYYLR